MLIDLFGQELALYLYTSMQVAGGLHTKIQGRPLLSFRTRLLYTERECSLHTNSSGQAVLKIARLRLRILAQIIQADLERKFSHTIYILYIIIVIMKDLNVHPTQEHWVSTRPLSTHEGCQPACIIRSSPNSSGVIRQFRIRRRRAGFARTLRA